MSHFRSANVIRSTAIRSSVIRSTKRAPLSTLFIWVVVPLCIQAILLNALNPGDMKTLIIGYLLFSFSLSLIGRYFFYNSLICAMLTSLTFGGLGMVLGAHFDLANIAAVNHVAHAHVTHLSVSPSYHFHSLLSFSSALMLVGCYLPCVAVSVKGNAQTPSLNAFVAHALAMPSMLFFSHYFLLINLATATPLLSHLKMLLNMTIGLLIGLLLVAAANRVFVMLNHLLINANKENTDAIG